MKMNSRNSKIGEKEAFLLAFLGRLREIVAPMFEGEHSGHDIYHLDRVCRLALHLQEHEGGERLVIGVAAFLHDIHRAIGKEDGRFVSPVESLAKVSEIIAQAGGLPNVTVKRILLCIEHHEEYSFGTKVKLKYDRETQIVQDADNLDAIGAVGLGRTFKYAGNRGIAMHLPDLEIDADVPYTDAEDGDSVIQHIHRKMLRIPETLNTDRAQYLADRKMELVRRFLREFDREWDLGSQPE